MRWSVTVARRWPDRAIARARSCGEPDRGDTDADLIQRLLELGTRLGRRSLIVCTADVMAVLVAENRAALEQHFLLPDVAEHLPFQLSDKLVLAGFVSEHGFIGPSAAFVNSMAEPRRSWRSCRCRWW